MEVEDPVFCDVCGKTVVDLKIAIITNCCRSRFCEQCVQSRENEKLFDSKKLNSFERKSHCPVKLSFLYRLDTSSTDLKRLE